MIVECFGGDIWGNWNFNEIFLESFSSGIEIYFN